MKTIYISDPRQIKNFLKRKQKKEFLNEKEAKRQNTASKKPKKNTGKHPALPSQKRRNPILTTLSL